MPKIVNKTEEPVAEEVKPAEVEEAEDAAPESQDEEAVINVEDLDPTLVLWEGGPTAGQIVAWKEKFGDVFVTSVTFDKHVVWRTLNRKEYKMIVKQLEEVISSGRMSQSEANLLNEELVCQYCILYPSFNMDSLANDLAGLPAIISQQILESSGFNTVDVRQL